MNPMWHTPDGGTGNRPCLPGPLRSDRLSGVRGKRCRRCGPPPDQAGGPPGQGNAGPLEGLGVVAIALRGSTWDQLDVSQLQRNALVTLRARESAEMRKALDTLPDFEAHQRPGRLQNYRQLAIRRIREATATILTTTSQRTTLGRMELSERGLFALGDAAVASRLQLTDDQREQVAAILAKTRQTSQELQRQAQRTANPSSLPQKLKQLRQTRETELRAVLTNEQVSRWNRLTAVSGTPE